MYRILAVCLGIAAPLALLGCEPAHVPPPYFAPPPAAPAPIGPKEPTAGAQEPESEPCVGRWCPGDSRDQGSEPRSERAEVAPEEGSLWAAAEAAGVLVGAAVNIETIQSDSKYGEVLRREFGYITPENELKWGRLEPVRGEWDFSAADTIIDQALAAGQRIKGHVLVWHGDMPWWVDESLEPADLRAALQEHVTTTVTRYRGKVDAWDVVNEAVDEGGNMRDTLLLRKLGPGYVADAFHWAHAADPDALLFYNDFRIHWFNAKANAAMELVKGLVEGGAPIHGVGFQLHIDAQEPPDPNVLKVQMDAYAGLGLQVAITELDVRLQFLKEPLPWHPLEIQRQMYRTVVQACAERPACRSVTTWGFTDRYSWIHDFFGPDEPLPFDDTFAPKLAFYGMLEGMGADVEIPDSMLELTEQPVQTQQP